MSGHTPGPWFVGEDESTCPDHKDSGLAVIDTGRSGDFEIAQHVEWNNAHLIAAAPELLDACKFIMSATCGGTFIMEGPCGSRTVSATEILKRAISKAEGGQ